MTGMSFLSFLVLLGIALVVAAVFHFGLRYRFLDGVDAAFAKVALACLGAWLGSPILGHWGYYIEGIYLIPAVLGSITAVLLNVVAWKAVSKVFASQPAAQKGAPGFPKAA